MSKVKKGILLIDDHILIIQGIKFVVEQMPIGRAELLLYFQSCGNKSLL